VRETHGDWAITETSKYGDYTHLVSGWGLCWTCQSLEDARTVAELLDHVCALVGDVWLAE